MLPPKLEIQIILRELNTPGIFAAFFFFFFFFYVWLKDFALKI